MSNGLGMWYAWRRLERYTKFWSEILKRSDYLGDIDIDGRVILRCILKIWYMRV
jgi:hypothetical protein